MIDHDPISKRQPSGTNYAAVGLDAEARAVLDVRAQLETFRKVRRPFTNDLEGYAFLEMHLQYLWDYLRSANVNSIPEVRVRAVALAAAAMKFVIDITGEEPGR